MWSRVASDFWPGATGWTGSIAIDASTVTTCGTQLGTMLGGYGKLSADDYVERTLDSLPTHSALRIRAKFFKVDGWNNDYGQMLVDGGVAWQSPKYSSHGDNVCGSMSYNQKDLMVELDVTVAHVASSATVRFTTTLTDSGDYWGIQDVSLSLVQDHPSPPAPPHPPGVWDYLVMHDRWPGATGWSGNVSLDASSVTTCGWLGTMIGGFERFGRGAYIEKTIDELSPHSGMRVQAQFYKIDQWNGKRGQLFVDDMLVWESDSYHQQSSGPQVQGTCCCGVKGYNQGWVHGRQTL